MANILESDGMHLGQWFMHFESDTFAPKTKPSLCNKQMVWTCAYLHWSSCQSYFQPGTAHQCLNPI